MNKHVGRLWILAGITMTVRLIYAGDLEVDNLTVNESVYLVPTTNYVIAEQAYSQWTLNDNTNTTTVIDLIGTNNGTMTDPDGNTNTSSHAVTGKINGALDFDGTNDYVDLSSHCSDYSSLSTGAISLWFKTSKTGAIMFPFGGGDNNTDAFGVVIGTGFVGSLPDESLQYFVEVSDSQQISFVIRNGGDYYCDGEWHHMVITVGTNFNKIYMDGEEEDPYYLHGSASTGNYFMNVNNLDAFGIARRFFPGYPNYLDGQVDNVIIYDRSITSSEVSYLYSAGSGLEGTNAITEARLGIGTAVPAVTLDVEGAARFSQGVTYSKSLGDISMGNYTNSP